MDKAVIYIHGKGGDAEEALHYKSLFSDCDVIGLDYTAQFPWEAKEEFPLLFNSIYRNYKTVEIIANSIGAYFAINALSNQQIEKAYFISPIVDMERLIADMMIWANVNSRSLLIAKEEDLIKNLNPKITGWKNYYSTKTNEKWMQALDWYIICTFTRWYNKKHQRRKHMSRVGFVRNSIYEKGLKKMARA